MSSRSEDNIQDESITDTADHASDVTDARGFNKTTIFSKNTHNQAIDVQIQGSVDEAFTDPQDIGAPIALGIGSVTPTTDSTDVTTYFPWYRVVSTCAIAPASGSIVVWALKGKLIL